MTVHTVAIDLNKACSSCGQPGAIVGNSDGLCRTCLAKKAQGAAVPGLKVAHQPPVPIEPRINPADIPHKGGLARSLFSLILQVERTGDRGFHGKPLPGGLVVEIGIGQLFNLRISRALPTVPSAREWKTVVEYLPDAYQPEEQILPRDFTWNGRKYLEAHWPIKSKLI